MAFVHENSLGFYNKIHILQIGYPEDKCNVIHKQT